MMKGSVRNGFTLWVLVWSLSVWSSPVGAATNDAVLSPISDRILYPYGRVEQVRQFARSDFPVLASAAEWVNGRLRADKEIRAEVVGIEQLQRIAGGHSSKQAFEHGQQAILDLGGEIIFSCAGRDCGQSNVWANQVFGQFRLYGKDGDQFYGLFAMPKTGQPTLALIYTVRRGNGQVYLYSQVLSLNETPPELADYFSANSMGKPESLQVDLSNRREASYMTESLFQQVRALASGAPDVPVWLVCHLENESMTNAEAVAECDRILREMTSWLEKKGIAAQRLRTVSAGFFPRACTRGGSHLSIEVAP